MKKFQSTKLYDGFSICYRDHTLKGKGKFIHGNGLKFKVWFGGDLDERNWVMDFGMAKRSIGKIDGMNPKQWFDYLLDHTTIIAKDDPYLEQFKQMDADGIIQLRILPYTGAERFAEYLFKKIDYFVLGETFGRVRVTKVEVFENDRNSASYEE